jgi:hypothetical protein
LLYFFIYCCQHHERKMTCLDIFLLSDRQGDTEHKYLLSRFLGVSILQLLTSTASTTTIYWRCHSNSVNTGSSLPHISDVKTWKRRNRIGIDMIWNNRIIIYLQFRHFSFDLTEWYCQWKTHLLYRLSLITDYCLTLVM